MQTAKGGIATMVLIATLLAGFGLWQFGGEGLDRGEGEGHEQEGEEYGRHPVPSTGEADSAAVVPDLLARYGGRIFEVEREYVQGREVLEIKLIDRDGRRREILVDSEGRELTGGGE